jgi:tetratricopeptide (TPR) repeat protein
MRPHPRRKGGKFAMAGWHMRTGAIVCLGATAVALAACAGAPRPELAGLASSLAPAPDGPPPADDLVRIASDIEAHGEPPTALLLYERAAAARQDTPTRIALGDAYLRAGRVDDAAKAYRSVLALDPDNDDAVLGLGTALVQQQHLSDGLRLLQRIAPRLHTALAYDRLGVAQILDGRLPAWPTMQRPQTCWASSSRPSPCVPKAPERASKSRASSRP